MKLYNIGAVAIACLISSMAVNANEGEKYGGIGYHMGSYEATGFSSASLTGLELKFGTYISDAVAFEGRLTRGIGDDTISTWGPDVNIELNTALSLFLKGDIPLSSTANLYGLIGFTKGKITASSLGFSFSEDESSLSYGIGAESEFSDGVYFSGEYVFYLSDDTYDYEGLNLGIKKMF